MILLKLELKNEPETFEKYYNKLRLFPLVQIISLIPCTVNRIYCLVSEEQSFYLMLFQCIFDSLTGLMFSCAYGMNVTVKDTLKECFKKLFRRKERKKSNSTNETLKSRSHSFNTEDNSSDI